MALLPTVWDAVMVAVARGRGAGEDGEQRERQNGERGGSGLPHGKCLSIGERSAAGTRPPGRASRSALAAVPAVAARAGATTAVGHEFVAPGRRHGLDDLALVVAAGPRVRPRAAAARAAPAAARAAPAAVRAASAAARAAPAAARAVIQLERRAAAGAARVVA